MSKATKRAGKVSGGNLNVTVSEQFVDRLKALASAFRIEDLGKALETFVGWKLENATSDPHDVSEELENWEFKSRAEAEGVVEACSRMVGCRIPYSIAEGNGGIQVAVKFGPGLGEKLRKAA